MVLKHNIDYCHITETAILTGPVLRQVQKESTPDLIYSEMQEMFDVFADVITNYAPISINIADFWNKRILDTRVLGASTGETVDIAELPVFVIYDGNGKGYNLGAFLGGNKPPEDSKPGTGKNGCSDTFDRFFINSLIGVQDKIAKTYMNSFYYVTESVKNSSVLRHRLFKLAGDNGTSIKELFKNTNSIFSEEKSAVNKTFLTKKGTELGLLYAGKAAFDAKIQGDINKDSFSMKILSIKPFDYMVEASILPEIFESFIKPLAHPIGMIYEYKSICKVRGVDDVDRPLIVNTYSANILQVVCRCRKISNPTERDRQTLTPEGHGDVFCDEQNNFLYTIATKNGKGLWKEINEDESNGGNILVDYKFGTLLDNTNMQIKHYRKFILKNHNYIMAWSLEDEVSDVARKVYIEYFRYDQNAGESFIEINDKSNYALIHTWNDNIHCNIFTDMKDTQKSQVTEDFTQPWCLSIVELAGAFEYLRQNQGSLDNPPANDNDYHERFEEMDRERPRRCV